MELRDIFTPDLMRDRDLNAIVSYYLRELQSTPLPIYYKDEVLNLRPYEVFFELDRVENELLMSRDKFIRNLELLEKLKRVSTKCEKEYVRIVVHNVRFPLGSAEEVYQPNEEIIPVKLDRWIDIEMEEWKQKVEDGSASMDYLAMTRQTLNRFMKIVGNKLLSEINPYDCREWKEQLQKEGAGNSSVNDYRRALKASFNRAKYKNHLKNNPFDQLQPIRVVKNQPQIVEKEELDALLQIIEEQSIKDVISFALLSAKRHGEILNLKWDDIDYDNQLISIHSSQEYRVKFGKDHKMSLSDSLKKLLKKIECYQRSKGIESDYIFVDENGNHLTERKVREVFKQAREIAELGDHITMHAMRRTAATNLKQRGVPTSTIKGILNHADEKITSRYLGVPKDDEVSALNMLDTRDFLPQS